MNNEVRVKLKELVATYGTELCTDYKKAEGLLRDYCGEHKREIAVLISAMKHKIPEEILHVKGGTIDQLQFSRLAKRLRDNEGIVEDFAEWAVDSWAVALGKEVEASRAAKSDTGEIKDEEEPKSKPSNTYPKEELSRPTVESYTDPVTGMEFVYVNGGCYEMGDTFGDGEKYEQPVHEVCVDDFYIGKYVVTQGQWEDVMGCNPSDSKKGRNYPVESVSWNDVQEFIKGLNQSTGKRYRLPTEAEWEYAARSCGKRAKYAGTSVELEVDQYAWFKKNAEGCTHPVGQKKPNSLMVFDMSGNVLEWCEDNYSDVSYKKHKRKNPIFIKKWYMDNSSSRVLRGGGFGNDLDLMRVTARWGDSPDFRGSIYGFRLASTP